MKGTVSKISKTTALVVVVGREPQAGSFQRTAATRVLNEEEANRWTVFIPNIDRSKLLYVSPSTLNVT